MKLCCIFNIPSLYREKIYLDIDNEYDCEWYFEKEDNDINLFDIKKLKSAHVLPHGKFISRFYRMKGLTGTLCKRKDFDAYLMLGSPMCVSIWMLCILIRLIHPKAKIYFWCHGWYGKETFAEAVIKKNFMRLAHESFIYGNYAKNLLLEKGFKKEKLHVIHNSLSYDVQLALRKQMQPANIYKKYFGNDNPVLIFIGRLTKVKKLDMLVEAVAHLREKGEKYNLVFVGDGVERESLEQRVESLRLRDCVWFYGACYDEATNAELVYNADLCVAPGNVGLTAMHTLMFGCPVITHNDFRWQMPEFEAISQYHTGNFFVRDDQQSLEEKISEWFRVNGAIREEVRHWCYKEIDDQWNPYFQMEVIKSVLKDD